MDDDLSKQAKEEVKTYLLLKYKRDWNLPNEYWEAALHFAERALKAEKQSKA